MTNRWVVGLASGSNGAGVEAALLEMDGAGLGWPGSIIWHAPEGRFPSTMTLGMAAVVAERTGVTTVSDFRSRDMAAGGQGAPLAALVDYLLFRHPEENRIMLHLGGIARIVY